MNTRPTNAPMPPSGGRWARAALSLWLVVLAVSVIKAQTENAVPTPPRDSNQELRTHVWSVYAQGGLSWATGVWYSNHDAKKSYKLAPAVGGGVDFTIRPWVRVGADYLWMRYRREQRFSVLDQTASPAKTYGNYLMNTHNAKLGVQFNFMELWSTRKAQWLNIWVGTGIGGTLARGTEYGMWVGNTITQGTTTTPVTSDISISNDATVTVTGNVLAANRHEKFRKLYIPATLHIEADVSRRFTLGVKGEMDWLLNRQDIAPKHYIYALATVRYNFVQSRARKLRDFYGNEMSALNDRNNALRQEAADAKARADREAYLREQAEQDKAGLKRQLDDCERSRQTAVEERRLKRVVKVLLREGFAPEDLHPQTAIGAQNGKANYEGRRVTITIKK